MLGGVNRTNTPVPDARCVCNFVIKQNHHTKVDFIKPASLEKFLLSTTYYNENTLFVFVSIKEENCGNYVQTGNA